MKIILYQNNNNLFNNYNILFNNKLNIILLKCNRNKVFRRRLQFIFLFNRLIRRKISL